jgi:hypothetical protein
MVEDETGNADIGAVVRALVTAVEAAEPRLRHPVASALQRMLVALRPALPHSLFERIMMDHYGLH